MKTRFNEFWLSEFTLTLKSNKEKNKVFCNVFQTGFIIFIEKKMTEKGTRKDQNIIQIFKVEHPKHEESLSGKESCLNLLL